MNKEKRTVSADEEIWALLDKIGERYGMSGNGLLTVAACELSRVRPENLWNAISRIAEGELDVLPPPAPPKAKRKIRVHAPIAVPEIPVLEAKPALRR